MGHALWTLCMKGLENSIKNQGVTFDVDICWDFK